jgi:hypothetical protein
LKRPPPVDILETSTWPIDLHHEGDDGMPLDCERGGDKCIADYDSNELTSAKETFELHLSAGILVPEEICNAERVLRRLNRIA